MVVFMLLFKRQGQVILSRNVAGRHSLGAKVVIHYFKRDKPSLY